MSLYLVEWSVWIIAWGLVFDFVFCFLKFFIHIELRLDKNLCEIFSLPPKIKGSLSTNAIRQAILRERESLLHINNIEKHNSLTSCSWQNIALIDRLIDRSIMALLQLQTLDRPKVVKFPHFDTWCLIWQPMQMTKSRVAGNILRRKLLGCLGETIDKTSTWNNLLHKSAAEIKQFVKSSCVVVQALKLLLYSAWISCDFHSPY
jgi:hypothetical protein